MQVTPYLNFDGQCAAAFKFYEECLGGKELRMMTHGNSPMREHVQPEWYDKILHARLLVGDTALMGSDVPPEQYRRPEGNYTTLGIATPEEAERIFDALAQNGTVRMPLQKTFWTARLAMLVDRCGTPWMINCDQAA